MMLMVAHELQSGCALIPEFGAMYGPDNTSEAQASRRDRRQNPCRVRWCWRMRASGFSASRTRCVGSRSRHSVSLDEVAFQGAALGRRRGSTRPQHSVRYRLTWIPSAKDRQTNPDLPADACLEVYLHEVELENGERLYLVTTLAVSSDLAAEYYGRRYDVEHDIRDVKVSLGIENIRAKATRWFKRNCCAAWWLTISVVQLRREAAKVAGVEPRRLSFTGVWTTMQVCLLRQPAVHGAGMARTLQTRRANRRPATSSPTVPDAVTHAAHHPRRPKSTKFMQQQTQNARNNERTGKTKVSAIGLAPSG